MKEQKYLIIGGGMSAAAALQGIRDEDESGEITVLSAEEHPPYDRPPLSKHLWMGKKSFEEIWRETPEGIDLRMGRRAEQLDLAAHEVRDDRGEEYRYEKLLLATGGSPRRLPFGGDDIIYFRDVESYRRLRHLSEENQEFAVIGGGFIGSEIAAALALEGNDVTMVFPETAIGAHMFPADLASALNEYYREKGVKVMAGEKAVGLGGSEPELTLRLDGGSDLEVHGVVAGIGITPNVGLAQEAGLTVDDGIVVGGDLRTSDPDVYAAGDVANFHDPILGTRRRVEHEDAANSQGRLAGRAMAGADVSYDSSPMFYSDLFDLGYEAVGRLDSRLETFSDWEEEFRKGVIYYLEEGRVRGVLLWDTWGKVGEARELIASAQMFGKDELLGRI